MKEKVCGVCGKAKKELFTLSPELTSFLVELLKTPEADLPDSSCKECEASASNARAFSLQYKAMEKTSQPRSEEEVGTKYDPVIHGPLQLPRVNISARDRARAEFHLARVGASLKDVSQAGEGDQGLSAVGAGAEETSSQPQRKRNRIKYVDEDGNQLTKKARLFPGKRLLSQLRTNWSVKDVYVQPFPFSAVCPICGSTLSSSYELYRHQQTKKCKEVARKKGLAEQSDCQDEVLVVVKDYPGPRLSSESLAGDVTDQDITEKVVRVPGEDEESLDVKDLLELEVCFEFIRKNSDILSISQREEGLEKENDVNCNIDGEQIKAEDCNQENRPDDVIDSVEVSEEQNAQHSGQGPVSSDDVQQKEEKDLNSNQVINNVMRPKEVVLYEENEFEFSISQGVKEDKDIFAESDEEENEKDGGVQEMEATTVIGEEQEEPDQEEGLAGSKKEEEDNGEEALAETKKQEEGNGEEALAGTKKEEEGNGEEALTETKKEEEGNGEEALAVTKREEEGNGKEAIFREGEEDGQKKARAVTEKKEESNVEDAVFREEEEDDQEKARAVTENKEEGDVEDAVPSKNEEEEDGQEKARAVTEKKEDGDVEDAVPSENQEEAVLCVETVTVVVGRRRREVGKVARRRRGFTPCMGGVRGREGVKRKNWKNLFPLVTRGVEREITIEP